MSNDEFTDFCDRLKRNVEETIKSVNDCGISDSIQKFRFYIYPKAHAIVYYDRFPFNDPTGKNPTVKEWLENLDPRVELVLVDTMPDITTCIILKQTGG